MQHADYTPEHVVPVRKSCWVRPLTVVMLAALVSRHSIGHSHTQEAFNTAIYNSVAAQLHDGIAAMQQ